MPGGAMADVGWRMWDVGSAAVTGPAQREAHPTSDIRHPTWRHGLWIGYLTTWLILKMGKMMAMAMNPTTPPIQMIMAGSIMLVTALIWSLSCLA